jgi:hypothetical protein
MKIKMRMVIGKKILLSILLLFGFSSLLFSAEDSLELTAYDVYPNPAVGFNINEECRPSCRAVNEGYKTKIVDFNPFTGITKCIIVIAGNNEENSEFNFVGDTLNAQCLKDTDVKVEEKSLASYGKSFNSAPLKFTENSGTLSKIFGAIATLDDDIINIPSTTSSNSIHLKSGNTNYTGNDTFNSLSSANLGFFVNLFYGFQKVYQYVQYFLFIFVGAFFLSIFIWSMAVDKVGKTGEKEKINKFIVPLVMILLCFVPIPKENSITTTPIQNIIQYFIQISNGLADRISVEGSQSYLKKLYSTVGASNLDNELNTANRAKSLEKGIESYQKAFEECKNRYVDYYILYKSFQTQNEKRIRDAEVTSLPEGVIKDYSFAGCRKIEADLITAEREKVNKEANLEAIESSLSNNELQGVLNDLQADMQRKSDSYGWYYSVFITSLSMVVENLSIMSPTEIKNATVNYKNRKKLI